MPLTPFSGTLDPKRAAHLLRRAAFGATKQQIDHFVGKTATQAVNELYGTTLSFPAPPIDLKTGSEWVTNGPTGANSKDSQLEDYFLGWFLAQMLSAGVPDSQSLQWAARERIVMFLHTHFTTIKSKVGSSRALYFQNALFRMFALDGLNPDTKINFKELTVKISVDNAMLRLLDGQLNVKGSPNENYARELHELYTIGRGLEGQLPPTPAPGDYIVYTETDIQKAALVLTGWDFDETFKNFDPDTNLPRGVVKGSKTNASAHDNTTKIFSDRFNENEIKGDTALMNNGQPTEESALDEIRQLVDQIYSKPETAKNICWKIYRFFVYAPHDTYAAASDNLVYKIDEEIIPEMVQVLENNNYKILPVIKALLSSQHFFDGASEVKDDNFGGIIKSPIDLIIGTFRSFEVKLPDMTGDTASFYDATDAIRGLIGDMQMNFYEPYDVAGYEAYHQFPIYHRFWITPNSLAQRYKFIRSLVTQTEDGMFKVNVYDYVKNNFNTVGGDARQLIIAIATYFLPVTDNLSFDDATDDTSGLTAKRLNYFKAQFLQGFDEAYWTTNWNNDSGEVRDWLEILFNTMLQSPEYQLA
jgi:uncharacterized protein (DUF1800 family)